MNPHTRRTAGLVATAAALAALPGTAHATPPHANATSPYIGTFYTVSYGIPKTLKLGTTITVGNWFMQNSKDSRTGRTTSTPAWQAHRPATT